MKVQIVEIRSRDYWFKIVGMLQQNWALIDNDIDSNACVVFFIHDASGVFDRLNFSTTGDAVIALQRNGFSRFSEDKKSQKYIVPPNPPFVEAQHPNGPIYSSGSFWA